MRWSGVFLAIIIVISLLLPMGSGMVLVSFKTGDVIKVLPGDYSYGYIQVQNPSSFDYKLVSFRSYRITDSQGNQVDFFNLSLKDRNYGGWQSGDTRAIYYNISCENGVKPGVYTLYLRFLGTTVNGELHIINLQVRIYVVQSPIEFSYAKAYVKERPYSPYALNGETIIVLAQLRNLGHKPVLVKESVSVIKAGKVYFSKNAERSVGAGDNVLTMEIPVGMKWPEGSYLLKYTVAYGNDTYTYAKEFSVRLGVKVVSVSIKSTEIESGGKNVAYATVTSEREGNVEFYVKSTIGNTLIDSYKKVTTVSPGTTVFQLPLSTNVTGNVTVHLSASFLGVSLGSFVLHYTVKSPPRILNVTYDRVGTDEVDFKIVVLNPNSWNVNGTVQYRVSAGGEVLYKDSIAALFKPGENLLRLKLKLPLEERVDYEFVLTAMGHTEQSTGHLYLSKPTPTTTSTTSTSTTSSVPSNTTTTQTGGTSHLRVFIVLVVVVFLILIGAYFLTREEPKKKKRQRPKPKRRSPLGRFKRPKPPRFSENKELPKK
ncbi:hypothetical protein [Thermococcus sp.]